MNRSLVFALLVAALGCEDTGKAPFSDLTLFGDDGGISPGGKGGSGGASQSGCSPSNCGSPNGVKLSNGSTCYCDSQCTSKADCCSNYNSVCGGYGGSSGYGGTSGTGGSGETCPTSWYFFSASCDSCMRSYCCSELKSCDSGTACRSVDDCRFSYCAQTSDIYSCMQNNCSAWGPGALETWYSYWGCMQGSCKSDCSG